MWTKSFLFQTTFNALVWTAKNIWKPGKVSQLQARGASGLHPHDIKLFSCRHPTQCFYFILCVALSTTEGSALSTHCKKHLAGNSIGLKRTLKAAALNSTTKENLTLQQMFGTHYDRALKRKRWKREEKRWTEGSNSRKERKWNVGKHFEWNGGRYE